MGRQDFEDDDRTIVDMSGISKQTFFGGFVSADRTPKELETRRSMKDFYPEHEAEDRPWENNSLSPEERRWYVLGAIKAALMIGAVYAAGLGLVVAFLLFILWR